MRKFCPTCLEQGLKSAIYTDPTLKSAIINEHYWDADGYEHVHEGQNNTEYFTCSEGHKWEESYIVPTGRCPRCEGEWVTRRYDSTGVEPGGRVITKKDNAKPIEVTPADEVVV